MAGLCFPKLPIPLSSHLRHSLAPHSAWAVGLGGLLGWNTYQNGWEGVRGALQSREGEGGKDE